MARAPQDHTAAPPSPKDFLTALRQTGPERFEVATSLIDRGVDVNGLYEFGKGHRVGMATLEPRSQVTALYDAAERGDLEAVQFLLDRGADARARNRTGIGPIPNMLSPFPPENYETLSALDGLRTSSNMKIVQLAEGLYGVESEEDFVARQAAFADAMRPDGAKPTWKVKKKLTRVKSVLPKSRAKGRQAKKGRVDNAKESAGKRYDLRSSNSKISYA